MALDSRPHGEVSGSIPRFQSTRRVMKTFLKLQERVYHLLYSKIPNKSAAIAETPHRSTTNYLTNIPYKSPFWNEQYEAANYYSTHRARINSHEAPGSVQILSKELNDKKRITQGLRSGRKIVAKLQRANDHDFH
ncbi:hypothetical protein SUGI_0772210 [Cryptomeria japonica]|nr:hypothetical protein SUGI_0772210 [Cryptomeria japonica]